MLIVKMLLGKIRLWLVALARLLFPTASRQRGLNAESEQGKTQRPEKRNCRLRLYTRSFFLCKRLDTADYRQTSFF